MSLSHNLVAAAYVNQALNPSCADRTFKDTVPPLKMPDPLEMSLWSNTQNTVGQQSLSLGFQGGTIQELGHYDTACLLGRELCKYGKQGRPKLRLQTCQEKLWASWKG